MQFAAANARIFHRLDEYGMREEFAIQDHQVDARNVHMNDAPGTHIQVANLAVSHLPLGQSHKRPAGMNERVGVFAEQSVVNWLARERDGVGLGFGSVSPAVEND